MTELNVYIGHQTPGLVLSMRSSIHISISCQPLSLFTSFLVQWSLFIWRLSKLVNLVQKMICYKNLAAKIGVHATANKAKVAPKNWLLWNSTATDSGLCYILHFGQRLVLRFGTKFEGTLTLGTFEKHPHLGGQLPPLTLFLPSVFSYKKLITKL
jgi:hypothetical protein